MNIQEFYEATNGNYQKALQLYKMEKLIKKFLKMFFDDKNMEAIKTNLESGNAEEAFRAAHTLKGVCLNLCFDGLQNTVSDLTESLRGKEITDESRELAVKAEEQYNHVVEALHQVDFEG